MTKLFAYHDAIATAEDVKQKFAELNRDNYPMEVYQYILDVHTETENHVIDIIGWCCELCDTPTDDDYFSDAKSNAVVICDDADGIWHLAY